MKDPIRVTTMTRYWRDLQRWLAPGEWAIWLLGLTRSEGKPTERGLIMVQIDGLSREQLIKAMEEERTPFIRSLLDREHYLNHVFYSGLPASTPAVQAELYYGDRTVVPAFGFRDHRTGRLVRMFANDIADEVEQSMTDDRTGLLTGGASYCNIYSGGADEVHFCATSFGWSELFSTINPFKLLLVMLLNFWMFFRVMGLMLIELVIASFEFVRGVLSGRQFWQELIMIPARVVVVVLLRELVTIGACYDAARGLPVIHLNLLGYDEQAHRRGPSSRFAHWTLEGIDRSIRKIWKAAHRGAGREYDVWVFSDHGQETTRPYQLEHGVLIQQVVAEMVAEDQPDGDAPAAHHKPDRLPTRANWLGIGWMVSMLFGEQDHDIQARSNRVQTVTSGPLGFVYLLDEAGKAKSLDYARQLVGKHHIPMTVVPTVAGRAHVITEEGEYQLPEDAVRVFGPEHPFVEEVSQDMIQLAHHKDSGEIVLVGWKNGQESTSFVLQNGAHAGPGVEETRAFALLPADTHLPVTSHRYLRPDDLRLAGLKFLGREPDGALTPSTPVAQPVKPGHVRILTYNVHACVGMDGQLSPERIARVIAQTNADIICLQELDVFRQRSGQLDQAHTIAQHLRMSHQFHPAWHIEEEQFGNAILTRFPMRVVEAKGLHHHKADRSRRSALWVEVDIGSETSLQIINTHLSIYPTEQRTQARELVEEWIQPASLLGPVVLCGDFNARPTSMTCRILEGAMHNVESFDGNPTQSTLFSPFPLTRVDHIFVDQKLSSKGTRVISSRMASVASDHLPLVSDLKVLGLADDDDDEVSAAACDSARARH